MTRVAAVVLFALLRCAHADEPAAPVQVTARTEPADHLTIGQRFRYLVTVRAAPDVELELTQPAEHLGDFDIVDFGDLPVERTPAGVTLTRWFTLVGWSPGYHLVKSPPVRYRQAGAEQTEAPSDEMGIKLDSLLEATPDATDIHDITGIEPVPVDWRPWWILGGGVAVVAAAAFGVWYALRGRRRRVAPAPPPRPPHEIATEALATLHRRNLVERGEVKEYYSALSAIIRTYLEGRYGLRAPEMTTEEFLLSAARDGRLAPAHRSLLSGFLAESDLVKFARFVPTLADAVRAMAAARRFVEETVPAAEGMRAAG